MDPETIRSLYSYDQWVNERLLSDALRLPEEQRRQSFGASFDTIHGTLAHILGAQINWLSRWRGVTPDRPIGGDDFASLSEVRSRWQEHRTNLDEFLNGLTAERLQAPLRYSNYAGNSYELPLWQLMMQVVNHGTHHRAELADMLTRSGHAPQPTDLIRYCIEKSGQA